jgi:hypothetical protein
MMQRRAYAFPLSLLHRLPRPASPIAPARRMTTTVEIDVSGLKDGEMYVDVSKGVTDPHMSPQEIFPICRQHQDRGWQRGGVQSPRVPSGQQLLRNQRILHSLWRLT